MITIKDLNFEKIIESLLIRFLIDKKTTGDKDVAKYVVSDNIEFTLKPINPPSTNSIYNNQE